MRCLQHAFLQQDGVLARQLKELSWCLSDSSGTLVSSQLLRLGTMEELRLGVRKYRYMQTRERERERERERTRYRSFRNHKSI